MSKYSFFAKEIKDKAGYNFKNMKTALKEKTIKKKKLKKIVYNVYDGYLQIGVNVFPKLECVCKKEQCSHIKKVLFEEFNLGSFILAYFYLPEVSTSFIDYLEENENILVRGDLEKEHLSGLNLRLQKIIFDKFSTKDCLCCLEPLNKRPMFPHLNQCTHCLNYTHADCIEKWLYEKKKKDSKEQDIKKGCIHCRDEINPY